MAKKRIVRKKIAKKPHKPSALSSWWAGLGQDDKHTIIRGFYKSFCWFLCIMAMGVCFYMLQGYALEDQRSGVENIQIRFANAGDWVPAQLKRRIADELVRGASDYRDENLTANIYRKAVRNPWISKIGRVRKYRSAQGAPVVELNCRFRRPIALVKYGNDYCYVDAQGVRLRESQRDPQVPKWQTEVWDSVLRKAVNKQFVEMSHLPSGVKNAWRIPYIVIELNPQFDPSMPPAGNKWNSPALSDGLKLAMMLYKRRYSSQITRIDVRNHDGRISRDLEHIGFWAGRTYFKFGRFPHVDGVDWVVPTQLKLAKLDHHVATHDGRLSGAGALDLRIETIGDSDYGVNIERH